MRAPLLVLILFFLFSTGIIALSRSQGTELSHDIDVHMSGGKLVDKVYNLTTDNSEVKFTNNIPFTKPYMYDISFGIITPHTCHVNISLWDPDGDRFYIYDSRDGDELKQFQYITIPFGVAITGNYSITFQAHLTKNLNIHIKIERSQYKCLENGMPLNEFDAKDFYEVNKFYNETVRIHNVTLKTDTLYRFYFGRYSPIAFEPNSSTAIDFYITSSIDVEYEIYVNEELPGVCYVEFFDFGTAVGGIYIIDMAIRCLVECVNIAHAIVEIERIADETDPNDPQPPPDDDDTNSTRSGIRYYVPKEWTIGFIAFVGSVVGIPTAIVVYRKRKTAASI